MRKKLLAIFSLFLCVSWSGPATAGPVLPYIDQGACPFECCVYGIWSATERASAYQGPAAGGPVLFNIEPGVEVEAIDGFVVTQKAGSARVTKKTQLACQSGAGKELDQPVLQPGSLVEILHYLGEGCFLVWQDGRPCVSGFMDSSGEHSPFSDFQLLLLPETEWWVRIRNHKGQAGWLLNPVGFAGSDGCG